MYSYANCAGYLTPEMSANADNPRRPSPTTDRLRIWLTRPFIGCAWRTSLTVGAPSAPYVALKRSHWLTSIGAATASPSSNIFTPGAIITSAATNANARSQPFISTSR